MSETQNAPDIYRTQTIEDLDEAGVGHVTLAYYDRIPHRIELTEPADDEGLYRSASVTYTADESNPFTIRLLSRYGEVSMCSYQYHQYEGFVDVTIHTEPPPEVKVDLLAAIPAMAEYLNDLLMFHRIDPPTHRYVSAEYHSKERP